MIQNTLPFLRGPHGGPTGDENSTRMAPSATRMYSCTRSAHVSSFHMRAWRHDYIFIAFFSGTPTSPVSHQGCQSQSIKLSLTLTLAFLLSPPWPDRAFTHQGFQSFRRCSRPPSLPPSPSCCHPGQARLTPVHPVIPVIGPQIITLGSAPHCHHRLYRHRRDASGLAQPPVCMCAHI